MLTAATVAIKMLCSQWCSSVTLPHFWCQSVQCTHTRPKTNK